MTRPTRATIQLEALGHNVQRARELAPNSALLAMVKANAYGHGITQIGRYLQSHVEGLGVACLEEALLLRQAGVSCRIVIMEGVFSQDELKRVAAHHLEIVVHEAWQVDALKQTQLTDPVTVWLKLDSGLHRLGFLPEDFLRVWQQLQTLDNVVKPIQLMTHLADADFTDRDTTPSQLKCFQDLIGDLPGERSIANSAAILAWPETHSDWNRPGLMLYGISPFADKFSDALDLKPVMTLSSELIAVKTIAKGESVGYSSRWIAPEDTRIGIVAMGYGDGYPRHAPDGTPVLIHGQVCPLVGTVSMDMLAVNVSALSDVQVGDEVVLWGNGLPVERIAEQCGTIPYEIICQVSPRVPKQVV